MITVTRRTRGWGLIALLAAAVALNFAWGALVLRTLWGWFLVPAGAPPLDFATAVGVTLVAALLTPRPGVADDDDRPWFAMLVLFGRLLFLLGLGGIFHLFL